MTAEDNHAKVEEIDDRFVAEKVLADVGDVFYRHRG